MILHIILFMWFFLYGMVNACPTGGNQLNDGKQFIVGKQLNDEKQLIDEQQIISLSPSLTKMIYLLEADDQLVGHTNFCDVGGDKKAVVASQMNVNTEKIVSMEPDVVITSTLTPSREIEALRKTGVTVIVFEMPESFDALCDQLVDLGRLTGKEEMAISIVNRERIRLNHIRKTIPKESPRRIFMQLGVKPLFSVVPGTFMNDYITMAGGENIASDLPLGTISRESVIIRNPEVILIVMMGMVGQEEIQNWQRYPGLSAAESNNIFLIDEDRAASPTPVSFVDTVEEIIDQIY